MNWLMYILIGIIIGWLIELLIDYFFWRRRRICTEGERKLSGSVNSLLEENANYRRSIVELGQRDELATGLEAELAAKKTELAEVSAQLKARDSEMLDLWSKVGRFSDTEASVDDLETSIANRDSEIANLKSLLDGEVGSANTDLEAKDIEIGNLSATLKERETELGDLRDKLAEFGDLQANLNRQEAEIAELRTQIAPHTNDLAEPDLPSRSNVAPDQRTDAVATDDEGHSDNLTKIWGIGPKINRLLNQAGIYTFRQLADTKVDQVGQILENAGSNYRLSDKDAYKTWPEQAAFAADGDWDGLQSFRERYQSEQSNSGDSLQRIWSIGPKAETLLQRRGIATFAQLAVTEQADIDDILDEIAPRFQFEKTDLYEAWVQQAQFINEGKRRSLKELQDQYRAKYSRDNLQKIWGIGPKTANVLRANGLTTFNKLADAEVEEISQVLANADVRAPAAGPDLYHSWIDQAQFAANGAWDSFDDLQDQLRVRYGQQVDDLEQVWGVDSKIEGLLREKGITSFDDLAESDQAQLDDVLQVAGPQFNLAADKLHEIWVSQAKLATNGDWEELELHQAQISTSD